MRVIKQFDDVLNGGLNCFYERRCQTANHFMGPGGGARATVRRDALIVLWRLRLRP